MRRLPCGSNAAHQAHRRRGEPIDDACREAHRLYNAAWRAGVRSGQVTRTADAIAARLEDYLFIGGDKLTLARAAERIGVTPRTITRYRARLRQQTTEAA